MFTHLCCFFIGASLVAAFQAEKARRRAVQERDSSYRTADKAKQDLLQASAAKYIAEQNTCYWKGVATGGKVEVLYASALESYEKGGGVTAKTSKGFLQSTTGSQGIR